jgi:hypothetical protein
MYMSAATFWIDFILTDTNEGGWHIYIYIYIYILLFGIIIDRHAGMLEVTDYFIHQPSGVLG